MTAPPTPQPHNPDLPRGAACPPTALGTKRAQRLFIAVPRGADPVEIKGCPPRSDPAKDTRVFAARTGSGASGTAGPRPHPPPPAPSCPIHPPAAPHPHLLGSALPPRSHRPGAAPRPLRPAGVRLRGAAPRRCATAADPAGDAPGSVILSFPFSAFQRKKRTREK